MIMNKVFLAIIISIIVFITNPSYCEVVDKIVVVVNNEIITQSEIDRMLAPIYEQYRALYYEVLN